MENYIIISFSFRTLVVDYTPTKAWESRINPPPGKCSFTGERIPASVPAKSFKEFSSKPFVDSLSLSLSLSLAHAVEK